MTTLTSGHTVTIENFSILGREDQNLIRTIKEALYIRANNPSLNRNVGKFHLPHIWDEVLLKHLRTKIKIMLTSGNSICHYGINICQKLPTLGGYSIYHHGSNMCQYNLQISCGFSKYHTHKGKNMCHLANGANNN